MRFKDRAVDLAKRIAARANEIIGRKPETDHRAALDEARKELDPASFLAPRRRNNGPNHHHPKNTNRRKAARKAKARRLRG